MQAQQQTVSVRKIEVALAAHAQDSSNSSETSTTVGEALDRQLSDDVGEGAATAVVNPLAALMKHGTGSGHRSSGGRHRLQEAQMTFMRLL